MLARAKTLRETSRELVARALEQKRETDSLHLHLRRVSDMNSAPFVELRKSVEDYAAALRTLGETPEQTIIQVKQIAVEAGREVEARTLSRGFDHEGVREEIVRWATQAYFAS
jgi:hypothetical protein